MDRFDGVRPTSVDVVFRRRSRHGRYMMTTITTVRAERAFPYNCGSVGSRNCVSMRSAFTLTTHRTDRCRFDTYAHRASVDSQPHTNIEPPQPRCLPLTWYFVFGRWNRVGHIDPTRRMGQTLPTEKQQQQQNDYPPINTTLHAFSSTRGLSKLAMIEKISDQCPSPETRST